MPFYEAPWDSTSASVLGSAVGIAISAGGVSKVGRTVAIGGAGSAAARGGGAEAVTCTCGGQAGTAAYTGTCKGIPVEVWCICTPAWCCICICICCCCCSACCCCTTEHVRDLWPMPPQTEHRWALFLRHEGPFSGAPIAKAAPIPGIPGRRLACVLATISWGPCDGGGGGGRLASAGGMGAQGDRHGSAHLQLGDCIGELLSQIEQIFVVWLVRKHLRARAAVGDGCGGVAVARRDKQDNTPARSARGGRCRTAGKTRGSGLSPHRPPYQSVELCRMSARPHPRCRVAACAAHHWYLSLLSLLPLVPLRRSLGPPRRCPPPIRPRRCDGYTARDREPPPPFPLTG